VGASGLFFLFGYVLMGSLWAPFLREMNGISLSLSRGFSVSAMSWLWRYVPGRIWAVASKAYLSADNTSQIAAVSISVAVESIWFQASGLLLAAGILPFYPQFDFLSGRMRLAAAAVVLSALVMVHPRVFTPAANALLRLLHQAPLAVRPRYGAMLLLLLGYMSVFLIWSGGFVILAESLGRTTWPDFLPIASIFTTAWTVGVLAVFAPAGLGVRDSLLAFALSRFLSFSPSLIVALVVGSRLLTTLVEAVCFGFALAVSRKTH
jgi:hypothetical protein